MTQQVNILVLGGSESGKTCFMLAMYDDMRIGYSGFTFAAQDVDMDRLLVDRFNKLLQADPNRWPRGNEAIDTPYDFNLNYAFRLFMQFQWLDYRGNMIQEVGDDYSRLAAHVAKADIVMICTPGDDLFQAATIKDRNIEKKLLVPEINQLLSNSGHRPSIVALVTKADLFMKGVREATPMATPDEIEAQASESMAQTVKRLYHPLMQEDSGWRVFVCPVTLGRELAANPDFGAIQPVNMHRPVMFAFYEHARNVETQWQAMVAGKEAEVGDLRRGWFTQNRTREALNDLEKLRMHRDDIRGRLSIAKENLGEYIFFHSGQRSELT